MDEWDILDDPETTKGGGDSKNKGKMGDRTTRKP